MSGSRAAKHGILIWQECYGASLSGQIQRLHPIPRTAVIVMSKSRIDEKGEAKSKDSVDFLMHTRFFDAIPEEAKFHLLVAMKPVHIPGGQRFINQGDKGDCFYIVQKGSCAVLLEKDGILYNVAVLGSGDIVGEMAILTGENRSAHVEAQTDIDLWRLSREKFDEICESYPEIRHFLTHVVADRFARTSLTADRIIGKYLITDVVGRGGWSIVYRGVHTTLNMPVAIKMLKHNMAMDAGFIEKFRDEARTIANLNHENIVKVYDIENLYRTVFIVMESLEGASAQDILKNIGKFDLKQALQILMQVCSGLAYAHERGIVHGDVKPGNIFVQKDGSVKLLDFGVACHAGTRSDKLMGTPKYFSPEQIKLAAVDARSDIYSLGISAFRMITGQEAFMELDVATLCHQHLYEAIPEPRSLVPDIPDEMNSFIVRATQKDPEARFQSMGQIIHELLPLAKSLGLDVPGESKRHANMMSLFLFYRDDQHEMIQRLVNDFSQELKKIGAEFRDADFKDL